MWSPNCLPVVSQMWFPRCCLPVCLVVFHLSPRCDLPIVFQFPSTILICLPELVFQLSPSVFHLSPRCFPGVFQMLFPTCHLVVSCLSCRSGLPIVSQFVPDVLSQFSPSCLPLNPSRIYTSCSPPMISHLLSNCFRASSQMWPFNRLPVLSLSVEFETIIAVGLQSWVNCVRLSGCLSLLVSVSLCLPPWLLVSDSLISLVTVLVSGFPCKCLLLGPVVSGSPDVSLHLSPFIYFLLWLVVSRILASVVWLYGCLSLRLFLHVSPTMASGVRLSAFHLCRNSFVFNHQSGLVVVSDSFACSPLCVSSII